MTFLGKLLVFLCLILGVGVGVMSAAVYTHRPPWFEPVPEGVDKGNSPVVFAQLTAEIDGQGKAAGAASASWGRQYAALAAAEKTRDDRREKMFGKTGLLALARGPMTHKVGDPAFFNLPEDEAARLLNLDDRKDVVKGPDAKPLQPTGLLEAAIAADTQTIIEQAKKSLELRLQQKTLGEQVVLTETRVLKQRVIRENQQNEAAYLASFEVNVAEQRETVVRRRDQLLRRLSLFGGPKQ